MKIEWNRRYNTIAVYAFLVIVGSLLFFVMLNNLPSVRGVISNVLHTLQPFLYGFVIAYILNPVYVFFEDKFMPWITNRRLPPSVNRLLAILITYLVAGLGLSIFFWFVIPEVANSISSVLSNMQSYLIVLQDLASWFADLISVQGMPPEIYSAIDQSFNDLVQAAYQFISNTLPHMMDFAMNFASSVVNFIVGIIISIYMFIGKEMFIAQSSKLMYALFPKQKAEFAIELARESNTIFSGFITGKIIDSAIIGVLCFAGLAILKMPYVMLVSVIVGITNVIPYFGPFIGAIPSALLILTESPLQAAIFLVFILLLQQFDGNILGPKILGDSTGLSAFWVIFAIMLFGNLMGYLGMFIGVPVFAVIYSLMRRFVTGQLVRKGLPTETKDYTRKPERIL